MMQDSQYNSYPNATLNGQRPPRRVLVIVRGDTFQLHPDDLEEQTKICSTAIEDDDHKVITTQIDFGKPCDAKNLSNWMEGLLFGAEFGQFDVVMTPDIKHLATDAKVFESIRQKLKAFNVELHTLKTVAAKRSLSN